MKVSFLRHFLVTVIEFRFTCGDGKLCHNVNKSTNILSMIVIPKCWIRYCNVYFFCFGWEVHFLGKVGPKLGIVCVKMKLGIKADSNMLNSRMIFKKKFWLVISFLGKFSLKRRNYQRWNLVPRLIPICLMQW